MCFSANLDTNKQNPPFLKAKFSCLKNDKAYSIMKPHNPSSNFLTTLKLTNNIFSYHNYIDFESYGVLERS